MMILMGFSISKVLIGILCVSLALILIYIAYKKLLAYLGKGTPSPNDYCVLYALEIEPAKGELEIYFTSAVPRTVAIEILNDDLSLNTIIIEKEYSDGGHIIRFDSNTLPNGNYFYCLRSDNQKTMKKMRIQND
jgi:hypothetical protein